MESKPESAAIRRSLVTFISAVSVLWEGRKPDWNCSYRLLLVKCEWSCVATIFSRIFERNGRLEIGRKFSKLLGSRPVFFNIGVMAAILREAGTVPVVSEEQMIADMRGSKEGRHALTKTVGMGSS